MDMRQIQIAIGEELESMSKTGKPLLKINVIERLKAKGFSVSDIELILERFRLGEKTYEADGYIKLRG